MAGSATNDPPHQNQNVDDVIQQWAQGDYVLGEEWFIHRFDPEEPITPESAAVASRGENLVESAVQGLVVLTQTCDIVCKSIAKPYIEVAPIIEVPEHVAREIERGRRHVG